MDPASHFWRPGDEAEATGTPALFIEWARATLHAPASVQDPASLKAWARQAPDACAATVAAFAGLSAAHGQRGNFLRFRGRRIALRVWTASDAYQDWTRDALHNGTLPNGITAALNNAEWADIARLAAGHLLGVDTRPDDTIQWFGAAGALWPIGAWLVGACVVLGGPLQPGARSYHAAPPWPD